MNTYMIPLTDLTVSRIAYGCAMLGADRLDVEFVSKSICAIKTAYDCGINFFDLADGYALGKSDMAFGAVLKQSPGIRDEIVIQYKCGDQWGSGGRVKDLSREHIISSVEAGLRRLGTDRIDILLLHWPDNLVEPQEVAAAFDQLHASGKVLYFGVSNHSPWQIELLRKDVRQPLLVNQIHLSLACWHIGSRRFRGALTHEVSNAATVDYCRLHGMQVQAYSPLKGHSLGRALEAVTALSFRRSFTRARRR